MGHWRCNRTAPVVLRPLTHHRDEGTESRGHVGPIHAPSVVSPASVVPGPVPVTTRARKTGRATNLPVHNNGGSHEQYATEYRVTDREPARRHRGAEARGGGAARRRRRSRQGVLPGPWVAPRCRSQRRR